MVKVTLKIAFVVTLAYGIPLHVAARGLDDDEGALDEVESDATSSADDTQDTTISAEPEGANGPEPAAGKAFDERTWSFGPYVRYAVVPSFMLQLFVDLAPSAGNAAFGATARYRPKPEGPAFDLGIGYASFAFEGAFRAKNGVLNDTEWVESSLGLLHLTGSIVWESKLSQQFAFEYGVGLDLGIVTGELKRSEAFVDANGRFGKCPGVQPGTLCQPPLTPGVRSDPYTLRGEQYDAIDEGVPPVFALPMVPRLALRYAPTPEVALRLEAGYGIAQIWFGLSAGYAPNL